MRLQKLRRGARARARFRNRLVQPSDLHNCHHQHHSSSWSTLNYPASAANHPYSTHTHRHHRTHTYPECDAKAHNPPASQSSIHNSTSSRRGGKITHQLPPTPAELPQPNQRSSVPARLIKTTNSHLPSTNDERLDGLLPDMGPFHAHSPPVVRRRRGQA